MTVVFRNMYHVKIERGVRIKIRFQKGFERLVGRISKYSTPGNLKFKVLGVCTTPT